MVFHSLKQHISHVPLSIVPHYVLNLSLQMMKMLFYFLVCIKVNPLKIVTRILNEPYCIEVLCSPSQNILQSNAKSIADKVIDAKWVFSEWLVFVMEAKSCIGCMVRLQLQASKLPIFGFLWYELAAENIL